MAQAALLNLKGTQLHPGAQSPRIPSPGFGLSPSMQANVPLPTESLVNNLPPPIGLHNQGLLDDHLLLKNTHHDGFNSQTADVVSSSLRIPQNVLGYSNNLAPSREMLQMTLGNNVVDSMTASCAQNGFTPMERLILQAHEQQRQQDAARAVPLSQHLGFISTPNASATEFRPAYNNSVDTDQQSASAASRERTGQSGRRLVNTLPPMSEEDFHATGGGHRRILNPALSTGVPSMKIEQKISQLSMDLDSKLSFQRQRNQTHAEARAQAQAEAQALHTRSTTMPSDYLTTPERNNTRSLLNSHGNAANNTYPTSHIGNVTSIHNSTNNNTGNTAKGSFTTRSNNNTRSLPASLNNGRDGAHPSLSALPKSHTSSISNPTTAHDTTGNASFTNSNALHTRIDTNTLPKSSNTGLTRSGAPRSEVRDADDEDEGSGLDSPALSYSASVRTPASLSPTTPFSAFGETFEGPSMNAAAVAAAAPAMKQDVGGTLGLGVGLGQEKARVDGGLL
jgi:hypothetical protein